MVRILRRPGGSEEIDHGLVLWFPGPWSATGEDVVELQVHGGIAVVAAVTDALVMLGCRPAEPGEFSRRAFLHGKLDLTAAEGIADLIAAETEGQRRQALRQASGSLAEAIGRWDGRLLTLLAHQEASIEFAEFIDPNSDVPPRGIGLMLRNWLRRFRQRSQYAPRRTRPGRSTAGHVAACVQSLEPRVLPKKPAPETAEQLIVNKSRIIRRDGWTGRRRADAFEKLVQGAMKQMRDLPDESKYDLALRVYDLLNYQDDQFARRYIDLVRGIYRRDSAERKFAATHAAIATAGEDRHRRLDSLGYRRDPGRPVAPMWRIRHAARRQSEIHRQAEAPSRTHRRRLRGPRRVREDGKEPGMGDGQQDHRRRQKIRQRPRQGGEQGAGASGWQEGRRLFRRATRRGEVRVREESRRHAKTQRGEVSAGFLARRIPHRVVRCGMSSMKQVGERLRTQLRRWARRQGFEVTKAEPPAAQRRRR